MNLQWLEQLPSVEQSPDILSGVWRFRGTRVPLTALFENLREGATVTEFLDWFPGVTQEQVNEILDAEVHALQSTAKPLGEMV